MKKQFILALALLIAGTTLVSAQGGGMGGNRMTIEESVARVHAKLDSAFKLAPAKLTEADSVFAQYYRNRQAKMAELMVGGERPDRETMMAETKKLSDARDEKLKGILTDDQIKTWKEQIEPSMRRGGGQGGGNRGNR